VPSSKQIDKLLSSFSQLNLIHERDIYLGQEIYHPRLLPKKKRGAKKRVFHSKLPISFSSCMLYIVVDLLCYRFACGVIVWEKKKNTMSFPMCHSEAIGIVSCTVVGFGKKSEL
jgi:hypothetical protein